MKKAIIIAAVLFISLSCSRNGLVGTWKLTEELIDIGDGKGEFKEATTQQTIEFFNNGTYSSTLSLCQTPSGDGKNWTGTYSMKGNKIMPDDCPEDGRRINFELREGALILNLACIEPCKQKYVKS